MERALFCLPAEGDRDALAYDAVRDYLQNNPAELTRLRRYLSNQGLRAAYPCPKPQS